MKVTVYDLVFDASKMYCKTRSIADGLLARVSGHAAHGQDAARPSTHENQTERSHHREATRCRVGCTAGEYEGRWNRGMVIDGRSD